MLRIGASLVGISPGWSSGFFIAPNLILTAAHCLRDRPDDVKINLRNGATIDGKIVKKDVDYDLGLIEVDRRKHTQPSLSIKSRAECLIDHQLSVARLLPERNDNGHPFQIEFGEYRNIVNANNPKSWSAWFHKMKFDTSLDGFSGSPIVVKGQVCGMLVRGDDRYVYAVPSFDIDYLIFRL